MYKGCIEGWPAEIVEQMLTEQVAQGNKRDVTVFEKNYSEHGSCSGFSWKKTIASDKGWVEIIDMCRTKRFTEALEVFRKYYTLKPYPKVMNVRNNLASKPVPRVVFMEKKGKFIAWKCAETIEDSEYIVGTFAWDYASDIEDPIYLTAQDISEGKGIGVKPELIKFKE